MSNENITETKPVEQTQTQTTTEQDNVKANENLLNTATKENAETTTTETTEKTETERPTWLPEKFTTAEDLAKSYTELEKTMAEKSAKVPAEYDFS